MADRSENAGRPLSRREFLSKASLVLGGAASLAAVTRNLPLSPFNGKSGNLSAEGSMFTPRPGSRLRFWVGRLGRFRLR